MTNDLFNTMIDANRKEQEAYVHYLLAHKEAEDAREEYLMSIKTEEEKKKEFIEAVEALKTVEERINFILENQDMMVNIFFPDYYISLKG